MARLAVFAFALSFWLASPAVHAQDRFLDAERYEQEVIGATGHPNEIHRWYGLWNLDNGRPQQAVDNFRRAAYYGDKLSQHMLSLMYWNGEGAGRDPVEAYIWADLAAERGTSDRLTAAREAMWKALSPEQQQQVRQRGPAYNQRYADAVAQPRTNAAIGQFKRARTGSRTGSNVSPLAVRLGRPRLSSKVGDGGAQLDMSAMRTVLDTDFYGAARTQSVEYWNGQDVELDTLLRTGQVHLGPVQKVRHSKTP